MKKIFTSLLCFSMVGVSFAQWTPTAMRGAKKKQVSEETKFYSLDINKIRTQLSKAEETGKRSSATIIEIPTLDGRIEKFAVYSLPVLEKSLADRYQLGSYTGVGIDDPTAYIRFSVAPNDFQSMLFKNGKYEFIEPMNDDKSVYGVFPKSKRSEDGKAFTCGTKESENSKRDIAKLTEGSNFSNSVLVTNKSTDRKYRTYRLAISTTGEYTQFFGGVAGAVTAINATMTRVNGVFEKDFAIHLNVQDFPSIIFTDAATDPYSDASTGADGAWALEVQQTLTSLVGNANYDMGHLFGRSGGGGMAGDIGHICKNPANNNDDTSKGAAYTSPGGNGTPQGDTFDIDYVAHEMGHQFGADHSFSFEIQSSAYRTAQMEPGSGSTIMGYAGITNYNVQSHSDAYFLHRSIEQVQTYVNTQSCDVSTAITNTPPTIQPLTDKSIPKGTAFVLTASATDAEGNPLTYAWEQYDVATSAIRTVTGDNTVGAKFRSLSPTTNPTRYFPKLSNVLNGVLSSATDWEAVPNVARTMKFKVTVRDNHPDVTQQQTQSQLITLTVGNDGPFKVTTTKAFNSNTAITWDVVNTNAAPYNVSNVKIDYTTDNGTSWTTLVASTPNDGSETVNLSGITANTSIIVRVSAIDNVFYAVGSVQIAQANLCDGTAPKSFTVTNVSVSQATLNWDAIIDATYRVRYKLKTASTWTEVDVTTNSYTLKNLDDYQDYEIQVAGICSGTVGTFTSVTAIKTLSVDYCPMTSNSSSGEYISNVTVTPVVGGGKEMSNTSLGDKYTNYSTDETKLVTLTKGTTGNKISVSKAWPGSRKYNETVTVWIDFNRDGQFSDSEKIVSKAASQVTPEIVTFSVPEDAYTGEKTVGMRVVLKYNTAPTNACTPSAIDYGEVEDYAVKINANLSTNDAKKSEAIQIFPNPAVDVLNVTKVSAKATYSIFNMNGQVVSKGIISNGKVSVSNLEKGVYIISIDNDGDSTKMKFIKK